ncbi:uncharacterized protein L969DRAFT_85255 [Mixia osmundae IAM 14324]|uniref:Arrestin-like N-terminal domain-containing protein n=1 Tax=Mixia osmundae (strain CBS 9802 / IAM 14324 / JCM 22182 / KY 12970) TaxID=764103 RepID=G7DYB2_MIXOS|nr:uncharacterized protein L969DRAFT_85255 [Mixia osmundae IAM 14324]KEI41474.1 hypothetical protein L969DRAFT_85255 [Mixia osmundae IAM 14324]GAA95572.1 hypothetical protein E5Q_02227 [Mixia osmundae IAM 14324]
MPVLSSSQHVPIYRQTIASTPLSQRAERQNGIVAPPIDRSSTNSPDRCMLPVTMPEISRSKSQEEAHGAAQPGTSPSSSKAGKAISSLLAQPRLKIQVDQTPLFTHPPEDSSWPSHDPILRGSIILFLPRPKAIRSITVTLTGHADLALRARPYESVNILEKSLDIAICKEDQQLSKGYHAFSFSFIVPSSTAVYERCVHGRIFHRISATARGVGLTGTSLSNYGYLHIIANPEPTPQDMPTPCQLIVNDFVEDIGPFVLRVDSPNLLVGGLLQVQLRLLSPPASAAGADCPTPVYSISAFIVQHCVLRSLSDPEYIERPPYSKILLFRREGESMSLPCDNPRNVKTEPFVVKSPLAFIAPGDEYKFSQTARLGDDNTIRPSTLKGTETPISFSHKIVVEIVYDKLDANGDVFARKKVKVEKSLPPIASCCCTLESVTLPVYECEDSLPAQRVMEDQVQTMPRTAGHFMTCNCGLPANELIELYGFEGEVNFMSPLIPVRASPVVSASSSQKGIEV